MINVVAGILVKDGCFFCARRKEGLHLAGHWEFPGGKVEIGESYKDALERELEEELGIQVLVKTYIGQSTYHYGEKIVRLHALLVDWIDGEVTLTDHDEVKWLPISEMDQLMWAPADVPLINQLKTYLFYENQTQKYVEETRSFDISKTFLPFLDSISEGGLILDLGCGSGRDSKVFKEKGFQVIAMDASPSIAALAQEYLNQEVLISSYYEMDFLDMFDGIWASASLLHCPKSEFESVVENLVAALKNNGVAYISLKTGGGEGLDEMERFFSFWSVLELEEIFSKFVNVLDVTIWEDVSELRGKTQGWVNILIKKRYLND